MICSSKKLRNFKPKKWELEPFDLKEINSLENVHPFYFIMIIIYKYYQEKGIFIIGGAGPPEEDVLTGMNYFKMLDNYYRYGIGFTKDMICRNVLFIKKDNKEDSYYILEHDRFDVKCLIFNKVKVLNIDDIDTGEKKLTKIEKWKRRVVNRQKYLKNKLTLINPDIYNNLSLFYKLSKSDKEIQKYHHIFSFYHSFKGMEVLSKKDFKNNYINRYKDIKIYEDKLNKKFSKYLN